MQYTRCVVLSVAYIGLFRHASYTCILSLVYALSPFTAGPTVGPFEGPSLPGQ